MKRFNGYSNLCSNSSSIVPRNRRILLQRRLHLSSHKHISVAAHATNWVSGLISLHRFHTRPITMHPLERGALSKYPASDKIKYHARSWLRLPMLPTVYLRKQPIRRWKSILMIFLIFCCALKEPKVKDCKNILFCNQVLTNEILQSEQVLLFFSRCNRKMYFFSSKCKNRPFLCNKKLAHDQIAEHIIIINNRIESGWSEHTCVCVCNNNSMRRAHSRQSN